MTDNAAPAASEVSVIIPAWRAEATIGRALASIAAQTATPGEVVVVDDGSDDATLAAARQWDGRLGGATLRLHTQSHRGAGAARNRAMAESSGRIFAFLDSDDEWLPDKLARSLAHLTDSGAAFVAHDMIVSDGTVERMVSCARHCPRGDSAFAALFRRGFVATSTVLARRTAIEEAGGFDDTLLSGQDYELWLKIAGDPGRHFTVFPAALTRYHVSPGSITSHVERRRRASRIIAFRYLETLAARDRAAFRTACTRAAIIAYEAAVGHLSRREWIQAFHDMAALPGDLARIAGLLRSMQQRPRTTL
jgi:glycosyltransferase involved in cell wall biosynthesis